MHLKRSAFFKLNWYHIYVAPRRHFESNCIISASWYWSHEIWFINMFILWYKRSFEKLYCSEELKKPIFFNVETFFFFWIFFNVRIFFSFWDICLSIRINDLRLYNNNKYDDWHWDKRLIYFINTLSYDFQSLNFNLYLIYSILFKLILIKICLNSIAARFLSYNINET